MFRDLSKIFYEDDVMPIENFEGKTFVAFSDVSGFKQMMKNKDEAWEALNKFYSHGYNILNRQKRNDYKKVEGLFISDCCVIFSRTNSDVNIAKIKDLKIVLAVIKELNKKMIDNGYFLTTTIVFGNFKYHYIRD